MNLFFAEFSNVSLSVLPMSVILVLECYSASHLLAIITLEIKICYMLIMVNIYPLMLSSNPS